MAPMSTQTTVPPQAKAIVVACAPRSHALRSPKWRDRTQQLAGALEPA
jgi:hypothetical protein